MLVEKIIILYYITLLYKKKPKPTPITTLIPSNYHNSTTPTHPHTRTTHLHFPPQTTHYTHDTRPRILRLSFTYTQQSEEEKKYRLHTQKEKNIHNLQQFAQEKPTLKKKKISKKGQHSKITHAE